MTANKLKANLSSKAQFYSSTEEYDDFKAMFIEHFGLNSNDEFWKEIEYLVQEFTLTNKTPNPATEKTAIKRIDDFRNLVDKSHISFQHLGEDEKSAILIALKKQNKEMTPLEIDSLFNALKSACASSHLFLHESKLGKNGRSPNSAARRLVSKLICHYLELNINNGKLLSYYDEYSNPSYSGKTFEFCFQLVDQFKLKISPSQIHEVIKENKPSRNK
jgi:hypothetical protein